MDIFEENLDFLKKRTPLLYRTVLEEKPIQSIYLEKVPNQDNYIIESKEAKCYMQSAYNIENEIRSMLKNTENDVDTVILFGIGNGDALKHIVNNCKKLYKIIVIEPSLQIFKSYLENRRINEILKKDLNITFVVNKKEDFVVDALYFNMLESKKASMVFHVSYCSVFNSYYNEMTTELFKILKVKSGDIRTFAGLWQLWLMNSIKNLKIEDVIPIEIIIDNFKGKTAVIVSAGPSLNKNINIIEQLKEKAIIVAVGSAIKVLESKGITPHFRVAIDGAPHENTIFKNIDTSSSPLIFTNQLYYEILPEYKGDKIRFILESEYLGKYIYKKTGIPFREFLSGSSVANGVLNFLCEIGCSRVVFMGQDLSYTEEGLHAKGITTEKEDKQWLEKQRYIILKNIYGEKVYSIDSYLQMKYVMEATIRNYKNIEFLNATEGGIGIEGAENLTAQEVFDKKLKRETRINLEEIGSRFSNEDIKKQYKKKIDQGLNIMKEELLEIRNIQEDMLKFIKKLIKLKEKNVSLNRIENELIYLETLENRIKEIPVYKEVVSPALQSDILSIKTSFSYKGSDRNKIVQSKEKIIVNSIMKVREYIDLAYKLIEDDYSEIIFKQV
ncbi:6-hydroxymethylpterin diphosphokinase MptE-like protein [Clostridium sp. KNHs214]|uniref:motility associated factor glycosyltransferase family protein n=1 Tax=Clostridium sp. KNHs214 TaxID=1540257 RepID=UPI000550F0E1|nr:6-hydroxymethylpterin diphosphokinase MptE-like protein [Clostridium sp. KNHs214]